MFILKKVQKIKEKYFPKIAVVILFITVILLFLSETYPQIKNILIDKGAINILVLIFVIDGINYLGEIKEKLEEKDKIKFYKTQSDTDIDVYNYIDNNKPAKADLLEYSSAYCTEVIEKLIKNNCKIRLLIAHPNIANSDLQKERIRNRISHISDIDFEKYKNVDIKCYETYNVGDETYKAFSSIRGRKFDDKFICIGWYTPTTKLGGGLSGYENPMICGSTDNEPGKILKEHFDDTFKILWDNGIPIEEVNEQRVG